MNSALSFIAKHKIVFIITALVLVAAIVLIVIHTWVPHIDLDQVSYITVYASDYDHKQSEYSVVIKERERFEITEQLERSLRKEARSNRFLKCIGWSVVFDYYYKDQSVERRICSGNLNFDDAERLVREFMRICPAG